MELDLSKLALLGILSASIHWVGARSKVTQWWWSRVAPDGWFDHLLRCAACSGFWIGLALGAAGLYPVAGAGDLAPICAGLLSVVATPVFEALLLWARDATAIEREPESKV